MEDFQEKLKEFKKQIVGRTTNTDTSGILLFKDFLHKMNEWNHAVGFTDNWINKICYQHDLFNIVAVIAPDSEKCNFIK
jgi:hypothetical protein